MCEKIQQSKRRVYSEELEEKLPNETNRWNVENFSAKSLRYIFSGNWEHCIFEKDLIVGNYDLKHNHKARFTNAMSPKKLLDLGIEHLWHRERRDHGLPGGTNSHLESSALPPQIRAKEQHLLQEAAGQASCSRNCKGERLVNQCQWQSTDIMWILFQIFMRQLETWTLDNCLNWINTVKFLRYSNSFLFICILVVTTEMLIDEARCWGFDHQQQGEESWGVAMERDWPGVDVLGWVMDTWGVITLFYFCMCLKMT